MGIDKGNGDRQEQWERRMGATPPPLVNRNPLIKTFLIVRNAVNKNRFCQVYVTFWQTKYTLLYFQRSGETKPNMSPIFKSASISGSRIRRKSYSPARLRKSTPPKRQRKQRTPTKKIPSTDVSPSGDVSAFPSDATHVNNENLPEMVNISEKGTSAEPEMGITRRENTEPAVFPSVLPLSVKCDNIDLIQEVLDKDGILQNTLRKTVTLQKSQKDTRDLITVENISPTLNLLNNVELSNEINSSVEIGRNSHLDLNSDIHLKNRIEEKSESRKFTCTKCGVVISSRAALTLHYNTKHLNNINKEVCRTEKSQETVSRTFHIS